MHKRLLFSIAVCATTIFLGCGGSSHQKAQVTGKVTAGGAPLPGGTIQFVLVSDNKIVSGGQIKPDGSYMVPDAPVGECKVVIDNQHLRPGGKVNVPTVPGKAPPPAPTIDSKKMAGPPKGLDTSMPEATTGAAKYRKIDASYLSAESTPLAYTVTREGGSKDFDVK